MLRIVEKTGPWGPKSKDYEVPLIEGGTVWDYIPDRFKRIDVVSVILNGRPVYNEELRSLKPQEGDTLSLAPYAGVVGFLIQLVVGIIAYVGAWAMTAHQKEELEQNRVRSRVGPTYNFDLMENGTQDGAPIAVLDGEMRIPGQIIQIFSSRNTEDRDNLNILLGLSEGPIEAINPNGVGTDLHINGNPAAPYAGTSVVSRLGTLNDVPIQGFQAITSALPLNLQLSKGSFVQMIGTTSADRFVVKLQFVSGCYTVDNSGHLHSADLYIEYRLRDHTSMVWGSWQAPSTPPFDQQKGWPIPTVMPGWYRRRRSTPFSIWLTGDFPSNDTWDIEIRRPRGTGHDGQNQFIDVYAKEYQQITNDDLIYPFLAKTGIQLIASKQLSGARPRLTQLCRGRKVMQLTSASAVSAPAWTQNPAHLALDKIYDPRYGVSSRFDTRLRLTLSGVSGGPYTVGEVVTGPTNDYQFRGIVRSWDNAASVMVVESRRGLPYGVLTGATSGATGTVSSIDEAYGVDLASFWAFAQFCDTYVPDGSTPTTVNVDSPAAGNLVYVVSTAGITIGDTICLDFEGPKAEVHTVANLLTGPVRIQISGTLANTHLASEANEVVVAEKRCQFDYYWDGDEDGRSMLERYARVSRAAVIFEPKIRIVPFQLETPTGIICKGNTGVRSFKVSYGPGVKDRPNRMDVKFRDGSIGENLNVVRIDAPELVNNPDEELLPTSQEMYGIRRPSQASREAWFRLKRMRYSGKQVQMLLGPDHLDLQVMDVRWLQNDVPGIGLEGGRVISGTATQVTLDTPVTLPGGTNFIRVQSKDGTQQSLQIANPAGTHRVIDVTGGTFSPVPVEWDLWAAGELGRYRLISLAPNQDGDAECVFEEDSEDFYTEKFGVVPTFTPTTLPDPDELPPDVEDIRLIEGVAKLPGGQLQHFIDLTFRAPDHNNWAKAEIYIKELTAQWQRQGKADFSFGTGNTEFFQPLGVWAGDVGGNYVVMVADTRNHRILGLDGNDFSHLWTIGTTGVSGDTTTNFLLPGDVCCDGTYVYVLDTHNHKVKTYNASTQAHVATFGSLGTGNGQFQIPYGITTDGTNVWVADTINHRIQKLLITAGVLSYVSQIGSFGTGNDQFNAPYGISVGSTNLYVADMANHRVHKRNKGTLAFVIMIGSGPGSGAAQFNRPVDVSVDSAEGYLHVADLRNHRLSFWDPSLPAHQGNVGKWGNGRDEFKGIHGLSHYNGGVHIVEQFNHQLTVREQSELAVDDFLLMGETNDQTFRILGDLSPGESYLVAVPSVSPANSKKLPIDAPNETIELTAVGGAPPVVANLYATNKGGNIRLYWDKVIALDLAGYEIRAGKDWITGQRIAQVGREVTEYEIPLSVVASTGSSQYLVKAFTQSQQFSATAATVTYRHPAMAPIAQTHRTFGPVNQRTT